MKFRTLDVAIEASALAETVILGLLVAFMSGFLLAYCGA